MLGPKSISLAASIRPDQFRPEPTLSKGPELNLFEPNQRLPELALEWRPFHTHRALGRRWVDCPTSQARPLLGGPCPFALTRRQGLRRRLATLRKAQSGRANEAPMALMNDHSTHPRQFKTRLIIDYRAIKTADHSNTGPLDRGLSALSLHGTSVSPIRIQDRLYPPSEGPTKAQPPAPMVREHWAEQAKRDT